MRHSARAILLATAVLLLPQPAAAQSDEATADRIRRAVKVWVGETLQPVDESYAIRLASPITVDPAGDRYRLVLPGGVVEFGDDAQFHFAPITADLSPLANGWYDTTWTIGTGHRVERPGEPDITIGFAAQSGRGVFAPEFETMMAGDASLSRIVVTDGLNGSAAIDTVTASVRSTEVAPGIYDVAQRSEISGVTVSETGGGALIRVDSIAMDADSDRIRMAEYVDFNRRMQRLSRQADTARNQADLEALMAEFADAFKSGTPLFAGGLLDMRVGGLALADGQDRFTLDQGGFTVRFDGLDQTVSSIALEVSSAGVATNDPDLERFLPSESQFRLAAIDLPNAELVDLLLQSMQSLTQTDPETVMMMAGIGFQQALLGAGSSLEIGPIRAVSSLARVEIDGMVHPEPASPYSVAAEIDMTIAGLDALIAEVQAAGGGDEAVQFLTVLQALGGQGTDAGGGEVRTYAFRLDAVGNLLLNGADLMPLIDSLQ